MDDIQQRLFAIMVTLWRKRWIMLGFAWAICLLGWAFIWSMPNKYAATARIYVDTDTLLSPLLKGISVDINMNRQVEIMQQTLLSRPNLESLLRLTDLDLVIQSEADREKLIGRFQSGIKVLPQEKNLFAVSYEHRNPELAKKVVQSLLTIFVETNLGSSRRDMEQARRFIEGQIQEYEEQLRAAEQRLALFKQEHLLELPESGNHAAQLEKARLQARQLASDLADARTRLAVLKGQVASTPQFVEVDAPAPVIITGRPTELELRISEQQKNLDVIALRYTENHPDVVAARRALKALQEEYEAEVRNPSRRDSGQRMIKQRVRNVLFDQIQIKALETEAELRQLERRLSDQDAEVARLDRIALSVPQVEAEFKSLDRDYKVMKASYEVLLQRREQARLSQEVEAKAEKTQYRLVDPPNVPEIPSSPHRPLLLSLVFVVALGAGVLLAIGLGQLDDSFETTQDVKAALPYPVLGGITLALSAAQARRRMLANVGFVALAAFLVVSYAGVVMFVTQSAAPVS